ncbi:MAG: dipeptidyl-peptidase 7 [Acidobacteria bacterium OLB17]|nr:MAG: dipeptidyl-peptidase 7 [Acidobacteria bacterium OLB17]MCZ2390060.1 S46 family peptidase [Acidobacteriota bacterium]
MKHVLTSVFIFSLLVLPPALIADEGMWTFDNPPLKQWKERYNFVPPAGWLDKVRLASVRLNDGGSASFVSPNGLIITNQHVANGQLSKMSTKEKDYVKDGFYAPTLADEVKATDLEANVLESFEDVTQKVQAAGQGEEKKAVMAEIEKDCAAKTKLKCEVISFYSGGEYWLYRFKKYTDLRIVFAPEEQISFFGGDYDNFTYPRYDLDITFLRAYENGKPAKTPNYFKFSEKGAADGEFIVVPGNPGSTARLSTVAQLAYQRDHGNPLLETMWKTRLSALEGYAKLGEEQHRQASPGIRSLRNSLKRLAGQEEGLLDPRQFGTKVTEEKDLRDKLAAKPDLNKLYSPAWSDLEKAYAELPKQAPRIAFSTISVSRLGSIASQIVRFTEETAKPNDERYDEYRDNRLDSLKFSLLSKAPIYPAMEQATLTAWLSKAKETLGANDPFIKAAIGDAEVSEVVTRAVNETKLTDPAARKALLDGGKAAVAASTDPMLTLARRIEPVIRELRAWNEEHIAAVETSAGERISKARFAIYGKAIPPDANFNLRLSYGRVKGYEEDTTLVPYRTTFFGLYDRAQSFDEMPPFDLPQRYKDKKGKFDMSAALDFVYTADTIGGNSGSPVINAKAEFCGINFDSNIQKLSNKYWYVEEQVGGRAVGVHSQGILEALRNIYETKALVDELVQR